MFTKATFKWPQQPIEPCYTTITKRTADADAAQVREHYHYSYYCCCFTTSVTTATAAAAAAVMSTQYHVLRLHIVGYVLKDVLSSADNQLVS
jgi:hypothetical protein